MRSKTLKQSTSLSICTGLALAAVLCAVSASAQTQMPTVSGNYTIQVIEPPEGTVGISLTYMNESGLLALDYWLPDDDPNFFGHSAVFENGEWQNIDVPGSISTGIGSPSA